MEQSNRLYYLCLPSTLLRLLSWLVVLLIVLGAIVFGKLNAQRIDFSNDANDAVQHVKAQILTNEVALVGFSSLLRIVGPNNLQETRSFTRHMREVYPHLYMFEATIGVSPGQKNQHEKAMRDLGYTDYRVYRSAGNGIPLATSVNVIHGVPMHLPIVFIDPPLDSLTGLMGYDITSDANIRNTLLASWETGKPVASVPFSLREGGQAYALIQVLQVPNADRVVEPQPLLAQNLTPTDFSQAGLTAVLMIKTDPMLQQVGAMMPAANVQLLFGEARTLAAQSLIPKLVAVPIIPLRSFVLERNLNHWGQPFTLSISQSAGLYSQDIQLLVLICVFMCFAYALYYRSLLTKYRLKLQRDAGLTKLSRQHDNLELTVAHRTQELQRKNAENTQLAHQLIRVQEDQNHHFAKQLHDEFGQTLTAIKINAHILETTLQIQQVPSYARDITSQADALYGTMRDMIQSLRPEALDTFGLKVGVEQCIRALHLEEHAIQLTLNIDDSVDKVAELYSIASYRIVQELINNTVKHAKPTQLFVSLKVSHQQMSISVEDNGLGFDPLTKPWGFGLSGVDERARSLGGTMDMTTAIDEGVRVLVRIPLVPLIPI